MMKKEFEINDILNAVNSISKIDKKKEQNPRKKRFNDKNDVLILTIKQNQTKVKSLFLIK